MSKDLVVVKVNDIEIEVQPDLEHEWLLSTKDVADGYGLSEQGVRMTKQRNPEEFEEGKHFVYDVTKRDAVRGASKTIMWTKRGVARLGFFIKTPMAKEFRDWAEDYIVNERAPKVETQKLPTTYLEALEELVLKERALLEAKPKAEYYDEFLNGDGCVSLTYPAKYYGLTPQYFLAYLRHKGYINKHSRVLNEKGKKTGWFKSIATSNGYPNTKVTPSGLVAMKELMPDYKKWLSKRIDVGDE